MHGQTAPSCFTCCFLVAGARILLTSANVSFDRAVELWACQHACHWHTSHGGWYGPNMVCPSVLYWIIYSINVTSEFNSAPRNQLHIKFSSFCSPISDPRLIYWAYYFVCVPRRYAAMSVPGWCLECVSWWQQCLLFFASAFCFFSVLQPGVKAVGWWFANYIVLQIKMWSTEKKKVKKQIKENDISSSRYCVLDIAGLHSIWRCFAGKRKGSRKESHASKRQRKQNMLKKKQP